MLACASPLFVLAEPATAQVVITELMAVADENFRDSEGAPSDWIELTNQGAQSAFLEGFHLTNSRVDLTRWTFPAKELAPGEAIVVFASGKDRTNGAELHASFTLDRSGDYLALVEPNGITIASEISPGYPGQFKNVSYGIGVGGSQQQQTLVPRGAPLKFLIPTNGALAHTWTQAAFNDSAWTTASAGVGFESPTGVLVPLVSTNIRSEMLGKNASAYLRFPFSLDLADRQVLSMELSVSIDDGFVAYLNGVEIGSFGKPSPLTWESVSAESRSDATVLSTPITISLGGFQSALANGGNVLAIHGMNSTIGGSDFVVDAQLEVTTLSTQDELQFGYFKSPTPGGPNGMVSPPPPADVTFSETGKMFTETFELVLSSESPGAIIHYTTDLSVPSETSPEYSSPIQIAASTQVRARAFLPGALDGAVTTHTFLKMADGVANFSSDLPVIVLSTLGTGSPPATSSTVRKTAYIFFFEPDPVTGRTILTQGPALTTRAGVRRRGSSSGGWPKYSLSVETWRDGDDEDRNIEPLGMAREADWILNARYEWDLALMRNPFVYEVSRQIGRYAPRTQFVEVFSDTTGTEVSDIDYFGVYSLIERIEMDPNRVDIERLMPWENAEPEITGGYIFKNDRPDPGEPTMNVSGMGQLTHVDPGGLQLSGQQRSWLTGHLNELNTSLVSVPTGINSATGLHFSDYIDVDSWIDHHLLNIMVMNIDWGRHSAFFHKDRGGKIVSGPVWDYDRALGCEDVRDNEPRAWEGVVNAVGTVSSHTWFDSRFPWYGNLLGPTEDPTKANYPEIRQRHTDQWFALREREFSISNLHAIIDSMADEIREAQVRNFVRWTQFPPNGGNFADPGLTGWEAEVSHMKNWLETRVSWMDEQYLAVPNFNTDGGVIAAGFELTMGSPDGQVFYTTDGTDPRMTGGAPAADALGFPGGPVSETLIDPDSATCRYIVPPDGSLGLTWTEDPDAFDDSSWAAATNGVGFESSGGIIELVNTNIGSEMRGTNASCYVRFEFDFENVENINSITLSVWSDDGFVAYLNGVEVGSLLKPEPLEWNSNTDGGRSHPGGDTAVLNTPIELDLTPFKDQMRKGSNTIAIHGMNSVKGGSDFLIRSGLDVNHNLTPKPLPVAASRVITARTYDGSTWSAPKQIALVVSDDLADQTNLVVSEIMYHPAALTADELAAGFEDRDQFEFLELLNISAAPVTLIGMQFTSGLEFDFNDSPFTLLQPGERALLVRDSSAFEHRYGPAFADRIVGGFGNDTGLSNGGERLTLTAFDGRSVRNFVYNDRAPWPVDADGRGHSLVLANPGSNPDHSIAGNWRSSAATDGTPGYSDSLTFANWAAAYGDPAPDSDDDGDGRDALLEFASGGDPTVAEPASDAVRIEPGTVAFRRNLRAGDLTFELESSDDLLNWRSATDSWEFASEENLGDGTAMFLFRPSGGDDSLYIRQRVKVP
ncbi:MAG: hypothetical protein ACJAQT_003210 [Akkermansiaceae bacterium]